MTTPETELIQATKDFATQCGQEWNEIIESMVLNAYREGVGKLPMKKNKFKKWFWCNLMKSHKWQDRGVNRFGTTTYRVCLNCRESQKIVSLVSEKAKFEKCEPMQDLDDQFDENDNYIFNTHKHE